jgi:tetratricopeptide (TPR) repeat protein
MTPPQSFAELLECYVQRDGRHARQLSQATATHFGVMHQIPHNTLSRWLRGEVKKPRNWLDIVRLAIILRLNEEEVNELLQAAGHPTLRILSQKRHDEQLAQLFSAWHLSPVERPSPFQAPPQLPTFVGREAIITQLSRFLRNAKHDRVSCLLGMAGLGKTSLATYLAYHLRDDFHDGVLWVRLERTDTISALASLAEAYGVNVSQYTDLGTRSSKVRELLAQKRALLVLDNASHDEEVRPLLPPSGRCAVIITSQRHDLSALDQASRIHLAPFDPDKAESLALFSRVLGVERVQIEREAFQDLAQLLGHLPLAINIVANRLQHEPGWTTGQLLTRLQSHERLNLLARGDQAVRLSFELSYQALEPAGQSLFTTLGVFGGADFSAQAVASVAGIALAHAEDGLRRLYSLSLVQSGHNDRYQLHPLLRDYSLERNQAPDLKARYAHYFIHYVAQHAQAYPALDEEISNIFAALEAALASGLGSELLKGVIALYPYLQSRGQLAQAHYWLRQAEPIARQGGDRNILATLLHYSGFTAMKQGDPAQAERYYQEALHLARQAEDNGQMVDLLMKLGALAHRRGQFEDARQFYLEALPRARIATNDGQVAALLANLGLLAAVQGDYPTAAASYEEALLLARQAADPSLTIGILQNLGDLVEGRGDYAQAKSYYQEGLALAEALDNGELRSRMLGNLGLVACYLGNYAEAAAHFRAGLTLAERSGLNVQICRQSANLGYVSTLRGHYRQANFHYQEAVAQARTLGFPEDLSVILNQIGHSYLAQDRYGEATAVFQEAREIAQTANLRRETAFSLHGLAQIAAWRGNVVEARRLGQEAQQILAAMGHKKANEVWWWLQELPGDAR